MPVTEEEVIWAYRYVLGREPESNQAISCHLGAADHQALRLAMMNSAEFQSSEVMRNQDHLLNSMGVPFDAPAISIETEVTDLQLREMWRRVCGSWEDLGQNGAHHSVLTSPMYMPDAFHENEAEFWASGETEATHLVAHLARVGVTDLGDQTCVEYGCGVGRLSVPLAERFAKVFALDISQPHLDLATERANSVGAENITFLNVGSLPKTLIPACDFFFSRIVLQHNPPPVIAKVIASALHALRPGGTALFQVPVYRVGYDFSVATYLSAQNKKEMEMHCIPQSVVFEIAQTQGCSVIDVREDNDTGRKDIFTSNTFVIRKMT